MKKSAARPKAQRPRVIVVAKRSALGRLHRGETDARARTLVEAGHISVRKWKPADEQHRRTLAAVEKTLRDLGAECLVLHGAHAEFDPRGAALVVSVGGDGTLLAASHSLSDVPLLGVNSAPDYSVGFFCAARLDNLTEMLTRALERALPSVRLARMAVHINDQLRSERVLNEALFCHAEPAATSNYLLRVGRRQEEQKSSGIWVGPAAGSTAAIHSAGGKILPFSSRDLQLVVREPYPGSGRRYQLLRELVGARASISLISKMQSARVFLDGPYRALSVRLGEEVCFRTSSQPLTVLGLSTQRRR